MEIQDKLLTPNSYSRPQTKIGTIKNIVIHWVGNANSTAIANRNYFESLKDKKTYASSHYIVGLDGEIIRCVPETEVAYHASTANSYSIGIENCHPDWEGKFNDKTYASLIELCADICKRYGLNPSEAIIRHYDVTKKECPKYYVDHEDAFVRLKQNVADKLQGKTEAPNTSQSDVLYRVVVGTYAVKSNADKMVEELKAKGYSSFIAEYKKEG